MPALSDLRLRALLAPYLEGSLELSPGQASPTSWRCVADPEILIDSLSRYLDLLLKWNSRTNLTAIRLPEQMVVRHLGESLFAARCVADFTDAEGVLDFGSGAGFPGIPMQLYLPELAVTLAESQGKKAAFLREAVRELGMAATVWSQRVGEMPAESRFDLVAMRAVDDPLLARVEAWQRVRSGGWLLEIGTSEEPGNASSSRGAVRIPGTESGVVVLTRKLEL